MPCFILLPILFMSIVYWMANLNNDIAKFVLCVLVMVLVVQSALAFGTLLSVVAPSGVIGILNRLLKITLRKILNFYCKKSFGNGRSSFGSSYDFQWVPFKL